MVSSQSYRSRTVRAWWATTGTTNRGFVSLDPERQCEVDSGRPVPKKRGEFTFDLERPGGKGRSVVPARRAPKRSAGVTATDAAEAPQEGEDSTATDESESGPRR